MHGIEWDGGEGKVPLSAPLPPDGRTGVRLCLALSGAKKEDRVVCPLHVLRTL